MRAVIFQNKLLGRNKYDEQQYSTLYLYDTVSCSWTDDHYEAHVFESTAAADAWRDTQGYSKGFALIKAVDENWPPEFKAVDCDADAEDE